MSSVSCGSTDVVVVGGGIAGSALATVLARNGLEVVVLERDVTYRDKVRGEALTCWGVVELRRLNLEQPLLDAGGGYVTRSVLYDEVCDPSEAEASPVELGELLPDVPGCLTVGHPEACQGLSQTAASAGATVIAGVRDIEVIAGTSPAVRYTRDSTSYRLACRLVVGADGRLSTVRSQLGIPLQQTSPRTMGGGMLVEGLHAWPRDRIALGTEADLHYLIFPRANGIVRLYLLHDIAQKGRFTGSTRQNDFLKAYQFRCIPDSGMFAGARPAGPCAFYPMNDSWTSQPYAPGAVLIGDAAGWNDPIIGQGLGIALRDARIVSDIVQSTDDWSPASFTGYGEERRERMRRLRVAARVTTDIRATFGPLAAARRGAYNAAIPNDLVLAGPVLAGELGPEQLPAASFEQRNIDRILSLG